MHVDAKLHNASSTPTAPNVVLLATDQKVFGFDLMETFRIAIGRHESNDLAFNSRNVSNYHAEILVEGDALTFHDLGSTNGSFVNEERVKRRSLAHGDRIRVGSHEILLRLADDDDAEGEAIDLRPATSGHFRRPGSDHAGPTLADILLGLCRQRLSVRLRLSSGRGEPVDVLLHEGYVVAAENGSARGEKALYRAFTWGRGAYETEPFPAKEPVSRLMTIPVDSLVSEGEQQADDIDTLLTKLPPPDAAIRLREGCEARICDLSPVELEVFQALIRAGSLAGALETSELTDLKVMAQVFTLVHKTVFELESSEAMLEQTNVISKV